MQQSRISIVIPVHNEGMKLAAFIQHFREALDPDTAHHICEILLVENGSSDSTWEVCNSLADKSSGFIRALRCPRASYGEAIKLGILESAGSHISILECDLLEVAFVRESLKGFERSAQFIVGSKRHPDATDLRPFKRRMLTRGFNWILRLSTGYPGTDTHGLKSIEASIAKQLCKLCVASDEVLQTELVLLAWRLGVRIDEVPVHLHERRPTPVSISRRLPKVMRIIIELHRSLGRFPHRNSVTLECHQKSARSGGM